MLRTHYRSPIDWTLEGLEESAKTLDDWYALSAASSAADSHPTPLIEALSDDLNTPQMIAALHGLRHARLPARNAIAATLVASLRLARLPCP